MLLNTFYGCQYAIINNDFSAILRYTLVIIIFFKQGSYIKKYGCHYVNSTYYCL